MVRVTLLAVLAVGTLAAAVPEGTLVLQAEDMRLDGGGWVVHEHQKGSWYTGQPLGRMLGAQSSEAGSAQGTLQLERTGRYRLWVRYLDMVNHRSNSAFAVRGVHSGGEFRELFDVGESLRATPEGLKKWGDGFAHWVWHGVEFEAAAGELRLTLEKEKLVRVHDCTRTVDLLLVTPDMQFEPRITDLTPLYVKVRMLPEQPHPVAIHLWGRRAFRPWYTEHANINRDGIFMGVGKGAEDMVAQRMGPGEESPWIDVAPFLAFGGVNQISLYAIRNYTRPESEAAFEFWFSKTPSEVGVFKHGARRGVGDGFMFAVDLASGKFTTEMDASEESLAMANATPTVPGKLPQKFPFFTTMALKRFRSTTAAIANEDAALRQIGITSTTRWPSHFLFHKTITPGCLAAPNRERIEREMREFAQKNPDYTTWYALNLMDEPGFSFDHIAQCETCQAGFVPYLKSLGLTADQMVGVKLCEKPEIDTREGRASWYYTRCYLNHIMTDFFRVGTEIARECLPGVRTTANFACELLDGNMVSRGVDWYELLGSGALTYGWHEDWGGWSRTRQVNGFYVDTMRSACRKASVEYGIYNILCRTPQEIEAHAYLALGRGVRSMHFFSYGPWYAIASDSNSQRPEIYEAIKRVTYATGAVEDTLLQAQPVAADAAQLLSVSGDIWYATRDNIFGKERVWLNLLLRHCNVRCDVLAEDDIPDLLKNYRVLFATDQHLKRAVVPALVEWVKGGGTLYLGADALSLDELGEASGLDGALGLERTPMGEFINPGRSEYEMLKLKVLGEHQGMKLHCGTCEPRQKSVAAGKGRVVLVGFFPGISYIATSKRAEGADYSILEFEGAHRAWMQRLLGEIGLVPRLRCDNHLVEANLLQGGASDLLVLSNWSGAKQSVLVELDAAPKYQSVTPTTGRLVRREEGGDVVRLQVEVGAGDFLELRR